MVCAYFSVSTAVLEEMYSSPSGNQFLQHSNKIHQGRIVAYHHSFNSFEKPNIRDFHKNQTNSKPSIEIPKSLDSQLPALRNRLSTSRRISLQTLIT